MLKTALIMQSRKDTYGTKEITNTGKILRDLWEEIGQEGFENWIRRAFVLVQSEKVLLFILLEQSEEKTNERKNRPATSEKNHTEHALSKMWQEWENSSTPHRRKPNEQLSRELNKALLQLSCETAPAEVFMRCLRSACQGSQSMQQTLASMEEIKPTRLGYRIHKNDKGKDGRSERQGTPSDAEGITRGTGDVGGVKCYGESGYGDYVENRISTIKAQGGVLGGGSESFISSNKQVRRLTPKECCRLQGYPDRWTDIPGASDSARYRALGNSFAIPNILFVIQGCIEMMRCEV